jgi:hypothetical protein
VLVIASLNDLATRPFAVGFVTLWFGAIGVLLGASPLFSFFAARTPQGRHVINPVDARIGAGIIIAGGAAAAPTVAWALAGDGLWGVTAIGAVCYAALYAGVARPRTGWSRRIAVAALACAPMLQAAGIALALAANDRRDANLLVLAPVGFALLSGLFGRRRGAHKHLKVRREPPARVLIKHAAAFAVPWYIRWPGTLLGLFFGSAMIGAVQGGEKHNAAGMLLLCGSIYLALCGTAFAGRELRALVNRRNGTLERRQFVFPAILATVIAAWIAALTTGQAAARGAFVLACFTLCAVGPLVGRRSARPRLLAASLLGFAGITVVAGAAALAAGDTVGTHGYLAGPAAGWAGFGLTMVFALPILRNLPALWPARLRVRRATA